MKKDPNMKKAYNYRLEQGPTPSVQIRFPINTRENTSDNTYMPQSPMALQQNMRNLNVPTPKYGSYENLQQSRNNKPLTPLKSIPNPIYQKCQVTRHGTSCNNIDEGDNLLGKDDDPSLSVYGIEQTIALTKEDKSNRFVAPRNIPIAVSGLIRTWETAVLLYGYELHKQFSEQDRTELKLRVCPWLKETNGTVDLGKYDKGNVPTELHTSIPKFIKFLNTLMRTYNTNQNYKINRISIYIPYNKPVDDKSLQTMGKRNAIDWQIIPIDLYRDTYRVNNNKLCTIKDSIYEGYGYYTDVGNIIKFMEWYTNIFSYNNETLHIVAHSQIMQQFVKENLKKASENVEEAKKAGKNIGTATNAAMKAEAMKKSADVVSGQNCWTIEMNYFKLNNKVNIIRIRNGYDKPKGNVLTTAKNKEKRKTCGPEENSPQCTLCGKIGLVEKLTCPYKGGGTRRKRRYRKKTRRCRR